MASKEPSSKNHVVVVLIPFPAQGHLNQLLHLSRVFLLHGIPVHYVGKSTHIRQATIRVQGWDLNSISNLHFHGFKTIPFASPPPNPNIHFPSHMIPSFETTSHIREPIASLLHSLSCAAKRVVVIHDILMASVAQDAATGITNVEKYTFHCTSAFNTFASIWNEIGRPRIEGLHVPQVPLFEECVPKQIQDLITTEYEFQKFNDGEIYNTSRAIEGKYLDLIENIVSVKKKIWALGPFNPLTIKKNSKGTRHLCMEWLDNQEANSVIYVSFGTTTTMNNEQIGEIATGLEKSKQKFIWVLRDADKGDIFDGNEVKRHELPNGFEERVKGTGIVVRDWAPQLEILSHSSTGGFMSHCGWNSCIESITMGVPIAAWPMHSDQPNNSVLITEVLKVGLIVRDWAQRNELVTASVIERVVRRLMETQEGEEMREKAFRLKNLVNRSMDDGEVSQMEMLSFIAHVTR